MPKTNEMFLKSEGFEYTTSLGLNMGYYHICLSEKSSTLCTIIFLCRKYHYKRLLMGVANPPEHFQQKMNDLFHGFEFVHVYINEILVFIKRDCIDNVQNLESMVNKQKEKRLKFNIDNPLFSQSLMKYLGF